MSTGDSQPTHIYTTTNTGTWPHATVHWPLVAAPLPAYPSDTLLQEVEALKAHVQALQAQIDELVSLFSLPVADTDTDRREVVL